MGQAAIPAEETHEFLTITDPARFMALTGVPDGKWRVQPAMVPCICIAVEPAFADAMAERLAAMSIDGHAMVESKRPLAPMSFNRQQDGFFQIFIQFDNFAGDRELVVDGARCPLAEAGLGMMAHEDGVNCTAQHVADGALQVYRAAGRPELDRPPGRPRISTVDIVPSLMSHFGLRPAEYMTGRPSLTPYLA
jgi:hypothetical protein